MKSGGEDAIRDAVVNAEDLTDAAEPAGGAGGSRDLRLARKLTNDSGNGERLRARYGRNLMFVPEIGRHFWTGRHWSARVGDKEWALAAHKTAARMMWDEAAALETEGGAEPKRVNEFRQWAVDSGNRARLSAMQAVSEPYLELRVDQLDADPFLFNVQNGTLELGSKGDPALVRLRRQARLDRITRIAPVGYDPDAECVRFRRFLDRIMPDREVQNWLQRWFGYCLTADYGENKLACFWGEGRNGKGVLTHLMQWLYGDYAAVIQFASLLADDRRRGGEASPDLAQLPGRRAVFGGEPKKGAKLDDGMLKQMTGGDDMMVRHLNRDFFELHPTFKLTLSFNNKPQIRDDTHGMWSRVMLVPFTIVIPEAEIDRDLLNKLKGEGPGILNWCLDGFRAWRDEGLAAPQAILAATAEYRSESDLVGQFLEAATLRDPAGELPSSELFGCYEAWARAMEYRPIKQTLFGKELSKRGIKSEKRGIFYRLGLKWNFDGIDWDWQVPYPP